MAELVPATKLIPLSGRIPTEAERAEAVAKLKEFRKRHTLGGLDIKALIEEGRE